MNAADSNESADETSELVGLLRQLRAGGKDALAQRMGIDWLEASPQRLVATMPVEGNTQPYGLLHGGASCVLAETLGSVGAILHAGSDATAVGIELSATHHRSVSSGIVTGVATPLRLGRTIASYEIAITDDQGRRSCTARLTCIIRPLKPEPKAN
ncbi:MAG: aromatic compound degradation protein PaaI [Acidimicrobiales bacterium]|nr:MAG: aromatic compound degradation protein PaaI [Acidimicrobiales bacterium]